MTRATTKIAPTEQASLSGDEAAGTASADVGVEQFARGGGAHGGGARGGAHGIARGGRGGWDHGGWGRGGRWDGWRRDHRYFPW